jgi:hypothetical protein
LDETVGIADCNLAAGTKGFASRMARALKKPLTPAMSQFFEDLAVHLNGVDCTQPRNIHNLLLLCPIENRCYL